MQPILLFLDSQIAVAANTMAQTAATTTTLNQTALNQESSNNAGGGTMEIVIRRVGMEDHINIVKLFQVCYLFLGNYFAGFIFVYLYFFIKPYRYMLGWIFCELIRQIVLLFSYSVFSYSSTCNSKIHTM